MQTERLKDGFDYTDMTIVKIHSDGVYEIVIELPMDNGGNVLDKENGKEICLYLNEKVYIQKDFNISDVRELKRGDILAVKRVSGQLINISKYVKGGIYVR